MWISRAKLCLTLLLSSPSVFAAEKLIVADDFKDLRQWVVEQRPGGSVTTDGAKLEIRDVDGCTVWLKIKLHAPVSIRYDAVIRSDGRVSDLNCFWMAHDSANPADIFQSKPARTGKFEEYDALRMYYVGYGGNGNTTTRFRRYRGGGNKPLLTEHDLRATKYMIEADHVYHIELIAQDGVAKFIRDGEVLFSWKDPDPLSEGWFGFRTVNSHLEIRNFRVFSLEAQPGANPVGQ